MSRWKAFSIHLVISLVIGGVVFLACFYLWYPQPYFSATGGKVIVPLIVGVDVVLGPLLTLMVFDPSKRSLRMDMGVVVLLQASALIYGLIVLTDQRPIFLVARYDRFVLVPSEGIEPSDLALAQPEFQVRSWAGPTLVGVQLPPPNSRAREELIDQADAGRDVEVFPQYFVSYASHREEILQRARPLAEISAMSDKDALAVDALAQRANIPESELVYLPLEGKRSEAIVLRKVTGEPIGVLSVNVWHLMH